MRALVRDAGGATALDGADCELVQGDVTDPGSLVEATPGVDAIVHLVAIIAGKPADFERVMVAGPEPDRRRPASGVQRFVYVSALGAVTRRSTPCRTTAAKWACEEAVAASEILSHAILRPSFVFGADGGPCRGSSGSRDSLP